MSTGTPTPACGNCGRTGPAAKLDAEGWCAACREQVVRRATWWARGAAVAAALLAGWWVAAVLTPQRLLIGWLVLVGVVYFFVYSLVRRVAFELIRSRGVPSAEE